MIKVCCFSGGKDSTAMLIHLLESNQQVDEVLYVSMGSWMWDGHLEHIRQVEDTLGVEITVLDVEDEIIKGFQRWGFPSWLNRWCTGIKRESMRKFLHTKYSKSLERERERERESIVQYIGYTVDEVRRTSKKLYSSYDVEYPLVEANITSEDALAICKGYGFHFNGVYEHHEHYNCWLCPLQKRGELEYLYNNEPSLWDKLRKMQQSTDGYYQDGMSIFDFDKRFWLKQQETLKQERMRARKKYNKKKK